MALCGSRNCGCAIKSNTLSITGSGTREAPWQVEIATSGTQLPVYSYADSTERDAALPSPADGQQAWLRTPNQLTRRVDSAWLIMEEPWTAYTPVWITSGTAPAIGNGSLVGRYRRSGKTCQVRIHMGIGSTTSVGTGTWGISLPPGVVGSSTGTATEQQLTLKVYHATQGLNLWGFGHIGSGASAVQPYLGQGLSDSNYLVQIGHTTHGSWTGSNVHMVGSYEFA